MWLVFELWVRVYCWYCISSAVHSYHGGSAPPRRFLVDCWYWRHCWYCITSSVYSYLRSISTAGMAGFFPLYIPDVREILYIKNVISIWIMCPGLLLVLYNILRPFLPSVYIDGGDASVLSHSISISIFTQSFMNMRGRWFLPYHISSRVLSVTGNRWYNEFWLMIYTIGRGHRTGGVIV
jgi:hypothetical protein